MSKMQERRVFTFGYNIRLYRGDYYRLSGEETEFKNGPRGKREKGMENKSRKLQEVDFSQLLYAAVSVSQFLKWK